jgi:hypothetical protein
MNKEKIPRVRTWTETTNRNSQEDKNQDVVVVEPAWFWSPPLCAVLRLGGAARRLVCLCVCASGLGVGAWAHPELVSRNLRSALWRVRLLASSLPEAGRGEN